MLSARKTVRIGPPIAAQRPQRIAERAASVLTPMIAKIPATSHVPAPLAVTLAPLPDRAAERAERAATRNIPLPASAQVIPAHGLPLHGPPPHGQNLRTVTLVARKANWNAKGPGQKNVAIIASRAKIREGERQRLAANIRSRKL